MVSMMFHFQPDDSAENWPSMETQIFMATEAVLKLYHLALITHFVTISDVHGYG
jgi:hypothetical protein